MKTAKTKKPTLPSTAKKRKASTATTKKKKQSTSAAKKRKTTLTTATTTTNNKKKQPTLTPPQSTTTQESSPFASLPYDLLLNCLARVPRLYYLTLSLVSKSFRSLLASSDLYKARSRLGRTETCLYVCFEGPLGSLPGSRWFTLCRKPDAVLTSKKTRLSSGYVLAKVPFPQDPDERVPVFTGLVAVGSNIYSIGPERSLAYEFSPTPIYVLDCWSHTWHEAPCLHMNLKELSASVLDQKIYVAGCSKYGYLNSSVEVFYTTTQTWDPKPIPCSETFQSCYYRTRCLDGKFHVVGDNEVIAYNSKEGRWDRVGKDIGWHMDTDSYCEIDNVLYSAFNGKIIWYDTEVSRWRVLKGLVGLPVFPFDYKGIRLADYGGKMVVLWHERYPHGDSLKKTIWCAEITLEKRKCGEIWGEVEWVDHLLTIPAFEILKVLAATV
ncbi:PREDICTED: F-box/kelch-repeat protein At5g38670-like [Camelina sativa]|uniref:F-box/kelch-repeat protein At5g38670-like n=1 Tax=Camelina sativa TaxID=90675 RepID=A0ABM0X4R5_CAMSA|nr:PREDICTED: F-box/kelch-repeat protein At5g38670-like [Camelina sativa]